MVIKPGSIGRVVRGHLSERLYHTGYFIALSAIIPAAAGYLFWGFSARLSTVDQVGVASALLAAAALLVLLSGLDLGTLLIRYLPTDPQPIELINTVIVLRVVLAGVVSAIFVIGIRLWSPAQSFLIATPLVGIAFIASCMIQSINELIVHIFVVNRPQQAMFKNIYVAFIRFPIVILAALWFRGIDGVGLYFTVVIGVLLILLFAFWRMLPAAVPGYHFRLTFDGARIRQLFSFSLLNYVGELSLQIPLLIAPVIIVNQLGNEASGIAYIVLMIGGMVAIIPQGLARSLLSEGAQRPAEIQRNLRRVLGLSLLLEAVMIVGILLVGHLLLALTLGQAQADRGMLFMVLVALSALPMTFVQSYFSLQRLHAHIGAITLVGGVVCLISVGLIVLLANGHGLTGVGLALLIGQIAGAVFALPTLSSMLIAGRSPLTANTTIIAQDAAP